ncbi:MAG: hypothetical protein DRO92_04710 [Candidatus Altiarchaeales archaeon]|nr:MAG: hypothetical protein DRO92_04710 [Candidatus Altiarchaeales archaeon]
MLDRVYRHRWRRKKVLWNDGKLKCDECGHVFQPGEYAYLYKSTYLGSIGEIICSKCRQKSLGNRDR